MEVVHEVYAGGAVETLARAVVHVELAVAARPPREAGARVPARCVVARCGVHTGPRGALRAALRPRGTLVYVCKGRGTP